MLFKMLCIERAWETSTTDRPPKLRQLFVTKSATLSRKVKEYFYELLNSLRMASLSPKEFKKAAKTMRKGTDGKNLINKGDQDIWERKLPACFNLLTDDHFPLFLSFDQVIVGEFTFVHPLIKSFAFSFAICFREILNAKQHKMLSQGQNLSRTRKCGPGIVAYLSHIKCSKSLIGRISQRT
jgi:hypothetical protein